MEPLLGREPWVPAVLPETESVSPETDCLAP